MLVPVEPEESFVGYLEQLALQESRGPLATLRRVLGRSPAEVPAANRHIDPFVDKHRSANPRSSVVKTEAAYYLIAGLFALHPVGVRSGSGGPRNFGASLARLKSEGGEPGIDRRFASVLNSHEDELADHLTHLVGYLKAAKEPVGVDWAQLLRDILNWAHPDRLVQRTWARAFWRKPGGLATRGIWPAASSGTTPAADEERPSEDEDDDDHD